MQKQKGKNLIGAEKYGTLTYLNEEDTQVTDNAIAEEVTHSVSNKLVDISATDYLLLIGDPILISIAVYYGVLYSPGYTLKVLKWDKQNRQYYPVSLTF